MHQFIIAKEQLFSLRSLLELTQLTYFDAGIGEVRSEI